MDVNNSKHVVVRLWLHSCHSLLMDVFKDTNFAMYYMCIYTNLNRCLANTNVCANAATLFK